MISEDVKKLFKNFSDSIRTQNAIMVNNIENTKSIFLSKYKDDEINDELNRLQQEGYIQQQENVVVVTPKGKDYFLN